jgi:hypothetical protein
VKNNRRILTHGLQDCWLFIPEGVLVISNFLLEEENWQIKAYRRGQWYSFAGSLHG